ncbi:MAG: hypothetical protein PHU47_01480 [Candidatus ainarchaeum sp.]|nr:hypothetical protein [Candidatus ainarchaeum sp.]
MNIIQKILKDQKAQTDSASTLYMLVIVAIVAIVLIAVIKPMFSRSVKTQTSLANLPATQVAAQTS